MKDEKRMNDENVKKGCEMLIMTWMINNPDKCSLFKHVEKKKLDIILEIILDKEKRDEWKEMEKNNPAKLLQLMMNTNGNANNMRKDVLEDLKDMDIQKEDVQVLSTINSLNDADKQYLNDHPNALSLFIRSQREEEERMRERQRQMERMRERRRQNLNAQRNTHHHTQNIRTQNIRNFRNIEPVVFQQPPRQFMEILNEKITSMLQKIFKTVNYNSKNNCYYCSLVEDDNDYLILPLFENDNDEIVLNQNIIEITNDFPENAIILIVPSEDRFNKDNFINDVKIITNIGSDISNLKIVDTISELVCIDNDDFSFKGCEKYDLHVKENYISKNSKNFDEWEDSFDT